MKSSVLETRKPSLEVAPTTLATFSSFCNTTYDVAFELELDSLKLNQHVKYQGQRSFIKVNLWHHCERFLKKMLTEQSITITGHFAPGSIIIGLVILLKLTHQPIGYHNGFLEISHSDYEFYFARGSGCEVLRCNNCDVCLCVCLSARISPEPHGQSLPFLCVLPIRLWLDPPARTLTIGGIAYR